MLLAPVNSSESARNQFDKLCSAMVTN